VSRKKRGKRERSRLRLALLVYAAIIWVTNLSNYYVQLHLGRTLKHLIATINDLNDKGIDFKSLQESIDTTTPGGKLVFHFFGALAEFERDIIRERTNAGLRAARARGRLGGRPKLEANPTSRKKIEMAKALHADPHNSIEDICRTLYISRATLYRYVRMGREGEKRS
jgi:DNA invertase Pin-like site-specific DNA recombinase